MLTIDKVITHIMEPSSDRLILSDACMSLSDEVNDMLEHKISRLFTSPQKKTGRIQEKEELTALLQEWKNQEISFIELSHRLTTHIFHAKRKYAQYHSGDMLMAELVYEGQHYIVGLDNSHSIAYTHQLSQTGDTTAVTIENCITLSPSMLKKDAAFFICVSDLEVSTIETKVEIEAKKCCFYNDVIFHLNAPASYREAIHTMNKVCDDLIDEYQLESVDVKGKMKQVIKEQLEQEEPLKPEEIAAMVFEAQPLAKKRFTQELKEEGIEAAIPIEHVKVNKADRVQRIKTDKGIELIIPIDFMQTTDYVEIINEEEGMISIRLKNIHRITSK